MKIGKLVYTVLITLKLVNSGFSAEEDVIRDNTNLENIQQRIFHQLKQSSLTEGMSSDDIKAFVPFFANDDILQARFSRMLSRNCEMNLKEHEISLAQNKIRQLIINQTLSSKHIDNFTRVFADIIKLACEEVYLRSPSSFIPLDIQLHNFLYAKPEYKTFSDEISSNPLISSADNKRYHDTIKAVLREAYNKHIEERNNKDMQDWFVVSSSENDLDDWYMIPSDAKDSTKSGNLEGVPCKLEIDDEDNICSQIMVKTFNDLVDDKAFGNKTLTSFNEADYEKIVDLFKQNFADDSLSDKDAEFMRNYTAEVYFSRIHHPLFKNLLAIRYSEIISVILKENQVFLNFIKTSLQPGTIANTGVKTYNNLS